MQNVPDIHIHDKEIPAGKVLIAEYRDIGPSERRPVETVLDTKTGWGKRRVRLVAVTAGWAIAGSMLRWDNGYYAVLWDIDGTRHGSRYKAFDDALAHFNRIPDQCPYAAYDAAQKAKGAA